VRPQLHRRRLRRHALWCESFPRRDGRQAAGLSDAERASVDTTQWKHYAQQADELSTQMRAEVDTVLKRAADIQVADYCRPERTVLLDCYKTHSKDVLACWTLAQDFQNCARGERMKV